MEDSRLDQLLALVDDARCIISEIREEGGDYSRIVVEERISESMQLQHIHRLLNDVIHHTNILKAG